MKPYSSDAVCLLEKLQESCLAHSGACVHKQQQYLFINTLGKIISHVKAEPDELEPEQSLNRINTIPEPPLPPGPARPQIPPDWFSMQ